MFFGVGIVHCVSIVHCVGIVFDLDIVFRVSSIFGVDIVLGVGDGIVFVVVTAVDSVANVVNIGPLRRDGR